MTKCFSTSYIILLTSQSLQRPNARFILNCSIYFLCQFFNKKIFEQNIFRQLSIGKEKRSDNFITFRNIYSERIVKSMYTNVLKRKTCRKVLRKIAKGNFLEKKRKKKKTKKYKEIRIHIYLKCICIWKYANVLKVTRMFPFHLLYMQRYIYLEIF